jgi:putative ABC transport system ATP-binding protein
MLTADAQPADVGASPLLCVRELTKRYRRDAAPILDGLDLTLGAGEYVAVMGESGAGKSTLLNLIAGLDHPDAGEVRLDGVDLARLDDDARTRIRRAQMGFVFQAFHVLPYLTVLDNVALPLELLGATRSARTAVAHEWLQRCGLAALSGRYPTELSGGELQRVAIARALVHTPRLVLADEPTGNLDARNAREILSLLREQLRDRSRGAILITHSLSAAQSADRILWLRGGRLIQADVSEAAP